MSESNKINNDTQLTLYKREKRDKTYMIHMTHIQYDTPTQCVTSCKRHKRERTRA